MVVTNSLEDTLISRAFLSVSLYMNSLPFYSSCQTEAHSGQIKLSTTS